jgi:ELWxxDGT repeat protein
VLFNGSDASGNVGLWVTNGTAAGTHELTGITNANTTDFDPTNFAVYGGVVLFNGRDTTGNLQLWETDGTAAGTHELTGVAGASSTGLNPADLTSATLANDGIQSVHPNNLAGVVHANDLALSGDVTGPHNFIDMLNFVASYGDLINAFGTNQQAAQNWYNTREPNRAETFDGLDYVASYGDLIHALGANNDAGATHYIDYGHNEGRVTTFDVAGYESTHPDLVGKFSSNDAFLTAYITHYRATGTLLT